MKFKFATVIKVLILLIVSSPLVIYAQETTTNNTEKQPVKGTFENAVLINNQTVEGPGRKSLDFIMQHRFGIIQNEKDIFGLYASANIRLGLTYGFTKRFAVGIGATKLKRYYDLSWKYILLQQDNQSTPVTITYYGNLARSADDEIKYKNQDGTYKASDRLTYFNELMFARKFNKRLSMQVAGTYSQINIVDQKNVISGTDTSLFKMKNNMLGVSFVGRYKFSPQSSVIFDFDMPITKQDLAEFDPKPNLGIGYEVSTGNHQFQIFICNGDRIIYQEIRIYNQNKFGKDGILFGFNITRQWGF